MAELTEGARVRTVQEVDRYPNFRLDPGFKGTVVDADEVLVRVKMDEEVTGAADWDNEVHWYAPGTGTTALEDALEDLELINEEEE